MSQENLDPTRDVPAGNGTPFLYMQVDQPPGSGPPLAPGSDDGEDDTFGYEQPEGEEGATETEPTTSGETVDQPPGSGPPS